MIRLNRPLFHLLIIACFAMVARVRLSPAFAAFNRFTPSGLAKKVLKMTNLKPINLVHFNGLMLLASKLISRWALKPNQ